MRKDWDSYFMDIAYMVSTRSTCDRLNVGCVIVKDNQIISTGYNGSIHSEPHCDEVGHLYNEQGRCVRTIHAEQNAILHADYTKLKGATAYITHESCEQCTKFLIQQGISRIVFAEAYENKYNSEFNKNVAWVHLNKNIKQNKLFLISGHSGSGKSSLMKSLMKNELVSVTTRERRSNEVEGKDYYFVSTDDFEKLVEQDELIQQVTYSGNRYGVTKSEFNKKIQKGNVFVIVAYEGMLQYKQFYEQCITIHLSSDYADTVKQLKHRGESDEFIEKRLLTYEQEVRNKMFYDYSIKNVYGKFNDTKEILRKIIHIESSK